MNKKHTRTQVNEYTNNENIKTLCKIIAFLRKYENNDGTQVRSTLDLKLNLTLGLTLDLTLDLTLNLTLDLTGDLTLIIMTSSFCINYSANGQVRQSGLYS